MERDQANFKNKNFFTKGNYKKGKDQNTKMQNLFKSSIHMEGKMPTELLPAQLKIGPFISRSWSPVKGDVHPRNKPLKPI